MINFDGVIKENSKEHNPDWPQIPDYSYNILTIGSSGSGKTNTLLNLISYQSDMNNIYLFSKDPQEAKYQLLINKGERVGLTPFFNLLFDFGMIWMIFLKILKDYNSNIILIIYCKKVIVFDDRIADMLSNKKLQNKKRIQNIYLVFIKQFCFSV